MRERKHIYLNIFYGIQTAMGTHKTSMTRIILWRQIFKKAGLRGERIERKKAEADFTLLGHHPRHTHELVDAFITAGEIRSETGKDEVEWLIPNPKIYPTTSGTTLGAPDALF